MEKMINYRLVNELEKDKRLPTKQYGLRRGRSTEDVHIILEAEAQKTFREKQVNIDTTMLALPKGSSTLRIRAELEETLNANYPYYTQKTTDRSNIEERVGCAVVIPLENKEI
jgi:hypothetical protein